MLIQTRQYNGNIHHQINPDIINLTNPGSPVLLFVLLKMLKVINNEIGPAVKPKNPPLKSRKK